MTEDRITPAARAAIEGAGQVQTDAPDDPSQGTETVCILTTLRDQISDLQAGRRKFEGMSASDREWWLCNAINVIITIMLDEHDPR